jgi:hypothetical protein
MDQHFHIFDDDKLLILLQLLACQQYIYIYMIASPIKCNILFFFLSILLGAHRMRKRFQQYKHFKINKHKSMA